MHAQHEHYCVSPPAARRLEVTDIHCRTRGPCGATTRQLGVEEVPAAELPCGLGPGVDRGLAYAARGTTSGSAYDSCGTQVLSAKL